jgi:peptidyl-prolyl cis-trans isomerase B (cyclophilin B)
MKYLFYLLVLFLLASCSIFKKTNTENIVPNGPHFLKIETDSGTMIARLSNKTPKTTANFLKLAKEHFYDSLLFHRVIKGFMIQGGDPDSKNAKPGQILGEGGLKYTVPAEFDTSLFHQKGAIAMARENDDVNPKKASSSTQFYIVEGRTFTDNEMNKIEEKFNIVIPESHRSIYRSIGGAPFLDMNYTVFGQVIDGLDVIDKIAQAAKDEHNRPLRDIHMKISIMKKNEYKKYLKKH